MLARAAVLVSDKGMYEVAEQLRGAANRYALMARAIVEIDKQVEACFGSVSETFIATVFEINGILHGSWTAEERHNQAQ